MEVLNICVLLRNHFPFTHRLIISFITLISSDHELEGILIKVDLNKNNEDLFSECYINMLGDSKVIWKLTSLNPLSSGQIVVVAPFLFIASDEQDIRKLALCFLIANARSA